MTKKTRTACSCGNPKRKGMTHMWLACWANHEPRPAYPKKSVSNQSSDDS